MRWLAVAAAEVLVLTEANFKAEVDARDHVLVEFYAPWCGHCKALEPEYEKAAGMTTVATLAKVDATVESNLATEHDVSGYPTLIFFSKGEKIEFDGTRTAEGIVAWIEDNTGSAVATIAKDALPPPESRPTCVLHAPTLLPDFEAAAGALRKKYKWYHVVSEESKVVITHRFEDPIEFTDVSEDGIKAQAALHSFPLVGELNGATYGDYTGRDRGLVWALFPMDGKPPAEAFAQHRPMLAEVAKGTTQWSITQMDTDEFETAVEGMVGVKKAELPIVLAVAAGTGHKYKYSGPMTAKDVLRFLQDVEAGKVEKSVKSGDVVDDSDEVVKVIVAKNAEERIFGQQQRDVMLEIFAPWCGHCKKLEPEYRKLGTYVKKHEVDDLLLIAKMDGTENDAPRHDVQWSGFPTIYYVPAGGDPAKYDGERNAKAMWKWIRANHSQAKVLADRVKASKAKDDDKGKSEL